MDVNNIKIEHCNDIRTIGSMKEELEAGRASYWHWHTLKDRFVSLYRTYRKNNKCGILLPEFPVLGNKTTAELEGCMSQGGYDKVNLYIMIDMYEFLITEDEIPHYVISDGLLKTERGKRILADAKKIEDSITEHCAKCGKEIRY